MSSVLSHKPGQSETVDSESRYDHNASHQIISSLLEVTYEAIEKMRKITCQSDAYVVDIMTRFADCQNQIDLQYDKWANSRSR